MKILLSLFDYTGNASKPYRENGWEVKQVDIKHGIDILSWDYCSWFSSLGNVDAIGIIAMIPCTDYALCGAKWFAAKDADGRTAASNLLVNRVREIIEYFSGYNLKFWQIENPASRIHKLNTWMGTPTYKFHPYWFAGYDVIQENSQYGKWTWVWGKFNIPERKELACLKEGYARHNQWGGKSERTKEYRSITPMGFANAFYQANH